MCRFHHHRHFQSQQSPNVTQSHTDSQVTGDSTQSIKNSHPKPGSSETGGLKISTLARTRITAKKSSRSIRKLFPTSEKRDAFHNYLEKFKERDTDLASEEGSSDGDPGDSVYRPPNTKVEVSQSSSRVLRRRNTSASDTSPLKVVPKVTLSPGAKALSASKSHDSAHSTSELVSPQHRAPLPYCMDVDEELHSEDEELDKILLVFRFSKLLSKPRKIMVRRAILVLRGLLHDQIQSGPADVAVPLPSDAGYTVNGEESITMEEHVELVGECSSLLSNYLLVYKGQKLKKEMIKLDGHLRKRLSDLGIIHNLDTGSNLRARSNSPIRVDKEVATVVYEDDSESLNQGQGVGDERVAKLAGTIPDPVADTVTSQSLTPECTAVDLSSVPPTTIQPATRLVASMMRNLADLLDCTWDNPEGKGRALDMLGPAISKTPYDLRLVDLMLNEFKSMKEGLLISQQRSKEEIARLHCAELISPREQMRAIGEETKLSRKRHREDMDSSMDSVHKAKKQRDTATVEVEGPLPQLEMLELQRRITALEKSLNHSPSQAVRPYGRPVYKDDMTISHPLGHLFN